MNKLLRNLTVVFILTVFGVSSCSPNQSSNTSTSENSSESLISESTSTSDSTTSIVPLDYFLITNEKPAEVYKTKSLQIECLFYPENATDKSLSFVSSNPTIASVSNTGLVSGLDVGTSNITVFNSDKSSTDSITVNVLPFTPVTSVTITQTKKNLLTGGFLNLEVKVEPEDATDKSIVYTSSNDSIIKAGTTDTVEALTAGIATITATSKTNPEVSDSIDLESSGTDSFNSYHVEKDITKDISMQEIQKSQSLNSIPNMNSKQKMLVIPVEFADYPFTASTINSLDALFNGSNEDGTTDYWESVCSFYKKSSYSKVNMEMTIADIYRPINASTSKQYTTSDIQSLNYTITVDFLRGAVADYKTKNNTDCTDFDNDKDGFIDAVYLVYSAPDYMQAEKLNEDIFWAFCYWDWENFNNSSLTSPIPNNYFWVSYDFMYDSGKDKIDSHTVIHETGHLLGAMDYYDYGYKTNPLGGLDMMDNNIGDHNMWTKMSYGWADPIVVTGNSRITIKSTQIQGDVIVLAPEDWNGTPFDEMITIELSTPTGLNKVDAENKYIGYYPYFYTKPGIRVQYADCRLVSGYNQYIDMSDPSKVSGNIYLGPSNTADYNGKNSLNYTKENYRQLSLIQSGKEATCINKNIAASDDDLFHVGDSFNMNDYQEFFPNKTTLDSGKKLPYEFYVESISNTEATIVVQKI